MGKPIFSGSSKKVAADVTGELTFKKPWYMPKGFRNIYKWDVTNSEKKVNVAYDALTSADAHVRVSGDEVSKEVQSNFNKTARAFNNEVKQLKYDHGKLGASFEGMVKSFADTLGFNTTKWTSSKISGTVAEAGERATKVRGNVVERIISKPLRIAAHYPKVAMVTGTVLAFVGLGSAMSKRKERETADNALANAVAGMQGGPASAQANSYQISAEEYAAMQAKMRGGAEAPRTNHADSVTASRQSDGTSLAQL